MMHQVINCYLAASAAYTPPSGVGAHRYWAISGVGAGSFFLGAGNRYWNVTEAQFLDQNLAAITSGSAISTTTFGGFPASNAFDGNTGTVASLNANNAHAGTGLCYVGRDFGSAVTVSAATVTCDGDGLAAGNGGCTTWQIIYSDDGSNWTVAASASNNGRAFVQALGGINEPADASAAAASHARLVILYTRGDATSTCRCSTAEVEFLASGTDQATGGTPFASTADGSFPIANAFDNNNSTIWTSSNGTRNRPQHAGYGFSGTPAIDGFSFTQRNPAGAADESPVELVLQRGSSSTGPWTTVKWRSGLLAFSDGEKRTY